MANNAVKTSELPVATSLSANDRVVVLTDPAGTPITKAASLSTLFGNAAANVEIEYYTPTTSSASAQEGVITYDSSYLYVAVANNSWKRISLSSF